MVEKGKERARYQTLMDAISAATQFVATLPPGVRVDICTFGAFDAGGWYWEMNASQRHIYGNTVNAHTAQDATIDYRDHNTREVLETGMTARLKQMEREAEHSDGTRR